MKIKKIGLISCTNTSPGLISKPIRFVPLNLANLMAVAPQYSYQVVDENIKGVDFEHDLGDVSLVGISVMTVQAPRAYALSDWLRAKGIPVVLGGSHVSALPKEAEGHADAVVIGEAEDVWPRLLEDFKSNRLQKFYKSNRLVNLSQLPRARRDPLLRKYNYFFPNTLYVSRGCPHNCNFCSVPRIFGRKYRLRPVPQIIEEIKEMKERDTISQWRKVLSTILLEEMGKPIFIFLDDNIFGRPTYAKKLFEELRPLKILWGSQGTVNIAKDEKTLKLAAESGCKGLFVGLESIRESSLREMGKAQNKYDFYEEAVRRFHKYGISVIGAFVFGSDSDDGSILKDTLEFARKINLDLAQFTILTPLPGTPLRDKLEREGRIISSDWSMYNFGRVVFEPKNLSVNDLENGVRWSWKKFYSPWSFLKRLPLIQKEWWGLLRKSPADAWIRLLFYQFTNFVFWVQVWRSLRYEKSMKNQDKD